MKTLIFTLLMLMVCLPLRSEVEFDAEGEGMFFATGSIPLTIPTGLETISISTGTLVRIESAYCVKDDKDYLCWSRE